MSLVTRKPVFGVYNQVGLSPVCAAKEARYRLGISDIETWCIILSRQRTKKVLIRLRGCAGWTAPLLFAYGKNRFSHDVAHMDRVKRIWYLSHMRAAKVQASLRIRAVSPEPPLLAHTNSDSRGTFRQKARSLAPLNGWACAVKICHDGMLEDTNSFGGAHMVKVQLTQTLKCWGAKS